MDKIVVKCSECKKVFVTRYEGANCPDCKSSLLPLRKFRKGFDSEILDIDIQPKKKMYSASEWTSTIIKSVKEEIKVLEQLVERLESKNKQREKTTGLDILTKTLAEDNCPGDWGLEDVNRKQTIIGCKYGDGGPMCVDCWEKALESEIDEQA